MTERGSAERGSAERGKGGGGLVRGHEGEAEERKGYELKRMATMRGEPK